MRFFAPFVALFAAVAMAQGRNNVISNGSGGLSVTAGSSLTISWENPSSGTVTIKLTQGSTVQPGDGITLKTGVSASDGTATLEIPAGSQLNGQPYNIEIIDDTNTDNINFSSPFIVAGASGTGSTTSSASATSSTDSSSTSSSEMTSMTSGSSTSHASTTRSTASRTSTSSSANATSSAPSANDASAMKAGSLLAVMVAAVAAF